MSIGFIGLGAIGKPMARQLLKLQEDVWVHDVAAAPVAELAALGAKPAGSAGALAAHCRIIGLCVRDDRDVEQLLYGDSGLFVHARPDTVIAVHSTVTQAGLQGWATEARIRGLHVIDAPITGGSSGAEAGTLCYMVGGDERLLQRARPVFETSGSRIIHAGGVGAGIALKLCNNLMSYAAFAAIHEGVKLAQASGLDPALLVEVGRSNGVVTPQMEAFMANREKAVAAGGAEMLRQFFAPFAALGRKDLLAALESASQLGVQLPATERLAGIIEDVFLARG